MTTPILATKLYIPRSRPRAVSRARLVERLDEGLNAGCKLTLVSASAGSGKTTLISEWVSICAQRKPQVRAAWLSLDENDNDPARFLAYFVTALQTLEPEAGKGVLGALQSAQPPPLEAVLSALLNEIAGFQTCFIFVLDDYHVIGAKPVDDALAFLLEHQPPHIHLVVSSREDPHLPLARFRARGCMTELRAADLRFTPSEAAEFLNRSMGLTLSAEDVATLETCTEGWIAGLQLAALSMRGPQDAAGFIKSFTGNNRFVMDFLAEEVLRRQSAHIRNFLLETSILHRLCGPLCDAITGRDDSRGMLEILERSNLFVVPLDDKRQWYRYHHLFADVLQTYLLQELPDDVFELHRRASEWFEREGSLSDAMRHALAAEDFERAARLAELAWSAMDTSYQSAAWLAWVKKLPDALIKCRPVLSAGYAWALLDCGELEACQDRLRDAEKWLDVSPDLNNPPENAPVGMVVADLEQFQSLPATIANARAYRAMALGNITGAVNHAELALKLAPATDHLRRIQATALLGLARYADGDLEAAGRSFADFNADMVATGNLFEVVGTTFVLADIRLVLGRLREALHTYEQVLQLVADLGKRMPIGVSDLYRGISELCCELGDLETAQQHLSRAKQLDEGAVLTGWPYRLRVAEARLKEARGELAGALGMLQEAERLYIRGPLPDVRPIAALKARVLLRLGRMAEAMDWAQEHRLSADDGLSYLSEFEHITLARLLIAQSVSGLENKSMHKAMELLERLLQAAETGGRMGSAIEILVLQALAHRTKGDMHLALASLKRALTLAEPESYVRVFADEGPAMAELLQEAAKRGIVLDYVLRLQMAFMQLQGRTPSALLLFKPLSERELEVLKLLATELSGPEIALKLHVSLNTLRTHTKNIFEKLEVNNRRAAVRRAGELRLL